MRTMPFGRALLTCAVVLGGAATLHAQTSPRRPKSRPQASLEEIAVTLSASTEDEVRSALELAATLPAREVMPLLEERVRAGLPVVLLDVALDTLLLLGDPSSSPLLVDLAQHRRPAIRARALETLARLRAPGALSVLRRGLGDLEPEVQKAAAQGLGELGAHDGFEPLARAFELGVEGAGAALGRVASSADVPRLSEYVASRSPETVAPVIEALLARREIAEAEKLRLVEQLRALGTEEAQHELAGLLTRLPRDASPALRRALTQAAAPGARE